MDLNNLPTVGCYIMVRFKFEQRTVWWPGTVLSLNTSGSKKRNTMKLSAAVIYDTFQFESTTYHEEKGRVMFLTSNLLSTMDDDGNLLSQASWKFNYNVPLLTEKRTAVPGLYVKPNPPTVRTVDNSAYDNIVQRQARSSFNLLDSNGRVDETKLIEMIKWYVCDEVLKFSTSLHQEPFLKDMKSRISALEKHFESSINNKLTAVWKNRCSVQKHMLRQKLLDYHMRRPFAVSTARQKHYFSGVFQSHVIKISTDCDYKLFTSLVEDIKATHENTNKVRFWPDSIKYTIPNASKGPIHVMFLKFLDLAKWLGVTSKADLIHMLYRSKKTSSSMAISMLGSAVYDAGEEEGKVQLFTGYSSSKFASNIKTEDDQTVGASQLSSKKWNNDHNRFAYFFTSARLTPNISLSADSEPCPERHFLLSWKALPTPARTIWSQDSVYTDSTILGTLTLVLPSAELMGRDAVTHVKMLEEYYDDDQYFQL